MAHITFIADLHLSDERPHLSDCFVRFMRTQGRASQALYILGDLFEFWVGDDEQSSVISLVQAEIRALTEQGIAVYFQHGNRDFLLGRQFAQKCGLTLLPSYHRIHYAGQAILLCHGDTLCMDDTSYQRFRRIVHQPWLQALFLALPLRWRLKIANHMRRDSQRQKGQKPADIMDVAPHFVDHIMAHYNVSVLVHGHTHRQAQHSVLHGQRFVLGDWRTTAPYLTLCDTGQWQVGEVTCE
ncbi:UDP-2,3-diacylglucosamine diphosphatase [Pasteurellaceae bacterium HPA106]|uniref:UDP-2,3-diacylglucosamine diphosphatase n=1 Tax=Spirabiliibacterium pneumoniae TaxID=221400 RepID=UPI001AAD12E3|nr:UDP-2,3-diacylglucosamine diphosphatase [Spirabiliibacterium pneumoniae]MBE2896962.1 UDP-2,3-diacylglucosamine diphosphatase [Spirabiliibacterium pneumoniae]